MFKLKSLRGGLAGLFAAAAGAAAFGGEAEGIVRLGSKTTAPQGIVIRAQSPCAAPCVASAPIQKMGTANGAPTSALAVRPIPAATAPAPRVTPISGAEQPGTASLDGATVANGEYAPLFSNESASPFDKFPVTATSAEPAVTPAGNCNTEVVAMPAGNCQSGNCPTNNCPTTYSCPQPGYGCPPHGCERRCVLGNNCFADKMRCQSMLHRARTQQCSDELSRIVHDDCQEKFNWFRCKFGYFFPNGTCGKGSAICGHYSMVYPVDPNYSDPRDCKLYAAQGYAGPVAVPLAPVVHHQYNYGWGVPSSRLTPVGNVVGPAGY